MLMYSFCYRTDEDQGGVQLQLLANLLQTFVYFAEQGGQSDWPHTIEIKFSIFFRDWSNIPRFPYLWVN